MTCGRDGCTGTIVDGYCDVCGMAARSEPAPSAATESILSGSATTQARRSVTSRSSGMVRGGLGAGLVDVPTVPYRDPSSAIMQEPHGRRVAALLRPLRRARRPRARRRPGTLGGILPQVRRAVLVRPQARRGRRRRRPVRGRRAASRTAGWDGSTWRATTTCPTAGWCSRACSTPATTTRRRPRSSSGASWPRSSTRTSSRSSTSSSTSTRATSSWSTSAARA